ncbi:MAG: Gfo/Idh/MocA family oxidoreductase [Verrucomicrobiota bacterium]
MPPTNHLTRRRFLAQASTASASVLATPHFGWSSTASGNAPSHDLRIAAFGAGGRAWGNISSMSDVQDVTLDAVAEVDSERLDKVSKTFPKTTIYSDWRQLLDKEAKNLDAVLVATPDHMHAPISMAAMQLGLHVYCEKPLTRTVHEARALRNAAAEYQLVSQMGNQLASNSANRTPIRLLQERCIGDVVSVHSTNPKTWGRMTPLPKGSDPVPKPLDWDLWLGVGKKRPFVKNEFHPSHWRKRIGFGTGTLGDMGCHLFHPWFHGLGLTAPTQVISLGEGPVDRDSWPTNCKVQYTFAGNDITGKKPFTATWYDGSQTIPPDVTDAVGGRSKLPSSGTIVLGTEGALLIPHGGAARYGLFRDGIFSTDPIERDPDLNHYGVFARAIREGGDPPLSNFERSGPLTETVLLGTIAIRLPGQTLAWDPTTLSFPNSKAATDLVKDHPYRKGWQIQGL